MSRRHRWPPMNSTLWRTSAAFWLLNAAFNGVTASVSATPSVYVALGGINVCLAGLSHLVSNRYRRAESLPSGVDKDRQLPMPKSRASELNIE
jgi:hypothetical protein